MAQYKIYEFVLIYEDIQNQRLKNEFIFDLRRRLYSEIEDYKWNPRVTIVIDVVDGSIKGQLKFFAPITIIAGLLANYGGIRDGIDHLANDSKWVFSQIEKNINSRDYFRDKYVDKYFDKGIVQEIHEITKEIDKLERNYDLINPKKQKEALRDLKQRLSNILGSMEKRDSIEIIRKLPNSATQNLPEPDENEILKFRNKYGLKEDDEPKIFKGY